MNCLNPLVAVYVKGSLIWGKTPQIYFILTVKSVHFYYHYSDVIMIKMESQITNLTIVYSTVYSGADQRKYQSSASLAFVREIHWWTVNFPHLRPITTKMFLFVDVIMWSENLGVPRFTRPPTPDTFCSFTTKKLYTDHDDVIKWKHFPCYWSFVRGIYRSPVNSPHKDQWRGAFMFSLICASEHTVE